MNSIMPDLRYALRQLRKTPTFALTAIVTLALGIGAGLHLIQVRHWQDRWGSHVKEDREAGDGMFARTGGIPD